MRARPNERGTRCPPGGCDGANIPRELRQQIDCVVSLAMGGLIIGHEMGRALDKDAMFLERPDGVFHLRRGFALQPGAKVLMVEDVVTTGLSSREAIKAVGNEGGEVIAEVSLVDRSGGSVDLGVPFYPLVALNFPTYADEDVPAELAAVPVTKPGSRAFERCRETALGVNIDHVATIRNARGGDHPDPVRAARIVAAVGDGIRPICAKTASHPRWRSETDRGGDRPAAQSRNGGDRRNWLSPLPTSRMPPVSCRKSGGARRRANWMRRPAQPTGAHRHSLVDAGIRVSLFIEAEERQLMLPSPGRTSWSFIPANMPTPASTMNGENIERGKVIADMAALATKNGIEHAGHGLTYENVQPIAAIPQLAELNIGHYLIGEAVFVGLENAVRRMRDLMDEVR